MFIFFPVSCSLPNIPSVNYRKVLAGCWGVLGGRGVAMKGGDPTEVGTRGLIPIRRSFAFSVDSVVSKSES